MNATVSSLRAVRARTLLPPLLLLPAAVLAWPWPALLAGDPFPHLTGTGAVALCTLPLACLLPFVSDGGHLRGLRLLAVLWGFIAIGALFGQPVDAFEARRAFVLASACLVLFVGGSLLETAGRRTFNRGLIVLSIVLTGTAFVRDYAGENALVGALGNSGPLSQAALPGAAIAAWTIATRRGLFWLLAWIAFGLFLAHAGIAPVYAGGLSLSLALVASSFLSPWTRRSARVRKRIGLLAAASVFVMIAVRAPARMGTDGVLESKSDATPVAEEARDFGGVEVRTRIWSRVGAVLAAEPLFGFGPGQFEARFPPYRDPVEAELSRGGRCQPAETDVEHAHSDALQGLFELGLFGGALWIAFLAFSWRAALRAVSQTDLPTIGAGVGALALLTNGLFHAPLTYYPLSATLGFVLLGAVFAREKDEAGAATSRVPRLLVAGVGLLGALFAWPLVAHGFALQDYVRLARASDALDPARHSLEDALELEARALATIERALDAAPDSAPARTLLANFDSAPKNPTPTWHAERFAAWQSVLRVRPFQTDALDRLARLHLAAGRIDEARESWLRAAALAPTQPRFQRELAGLELLHGDTNDGLARVRAIESGACDEERWVAWLGSELVLRGKWDAGARVWFDAGIDTLSGDELNTVARSSSEGDLPNHALALRCLAHLVWAREQIAVGDVDTAIRSYRQVLSPTRAFYADGAPAARAELLAAYLLAGRTDDATATAAGIELPARMFTALPDWARDALRNAGYRPRAGS